MNVAAALRRLVPDAPEPVLLGEGVDNVAYAAGELIVRVAKRVDPAAIRREVAVLGAVVGLAGDVPVVVPRVLAVDESAGVLVYQGVPGVSLLYGRQVPDTLGMILGRLLSALHAAPTSLAGDGASGTEEPAVWLASAGEDYAEAAPVLTPEQRVAVQAFLAADPPPVGSPPVLAHNDLGAEHLVFDPETGTLGVIDWADATITHRAVDFGRIYRDFGPAVHAEALAHYIPQWTDADELLARFFARCALIEDLAYGCTEGRPEYVRAALEGFGHTFA